ADQEEPIDPAIVIPPVARYAPPPSPAAPEATVEIAVEAIRKARRPVILCGRVSRSPNSWERRIAFAEKAGAVVLTSIVNSAAYPSDHAQHVLPVCGDVRTQAEKDIINQADLIISLNWLDL